MTYDNQSKSTVTYEYEDGKLYSYDNNSNWSNTYEYGDGNFLPSKVMIIGSNKLFNV